uniref:Protocadherin alpha 8-like n=1 Tax=Gasterosteus aculeatus aculeatus TaxID=481459 RepID=A0AAQ4QEM1_GASAC
MVGWWVAGILLQWCGENVFAQLRYSVPEEIQVGSPVGNVAKDLGLDISTLTGRRFRIVSGPNHALFHLNQNNGVLSIGNIVDREELCDGIKVCLINLKIVVESPLEIHYVGVEILDVNDHSPVFPESEQQLEIAEHTPPGTRFQIHAARDPDIGPQSVQLYKLNPNDLFDTEIRDSEEDKIPFLVLKRPLDREQKSEHHLVLMALDGGSPSKSGSLNLTITVLDANDNRPVFSRDIYTVSLDENSPIGTLVIQLNATDLDEGLNSEIEYTFGKTQKKKVQDTFELDSLTGEIRVKGKVDFEEIEIYRLDLQASDKGHPPWTAESRVVIKIKDLNDNQPEIEVTSLSKVVPEDSKPGTVISLISVMDKDSGLNGKVICKILDDVPFDLTPSIEENMYSLVTKGHLDRESVSHYDITITANDCGDPSLSIVKSLSIEVSDVNDNRPVFSQNPVELYLVENNYPGESIISVSAADIDVRQSDEDKIPFLVLKKSLDREQKNNHTLVVTAVDGGKPPKSGTLNVSIIVLDSNDNRPIFSQEIYQITLNENVSVGTSVIQLNATDSDEGTNSEIEYSLGKTMKKKVYDIFELDKSTGMITIKEVVDYEENDVCKLDIEASDKGTPPLTGECRVIIKIKDVNDNPPEIDVTSLSNIVSEDSKPGTVISLLSTMDRDSGVNGKIITRIISGVPFELKPSYKDNIYSVVTKGFLDREEASHYEIIIKATDCGEPPLSTVKKLSINISDVNDNSPQFDRNRSQFYLKENNAAGASIFSVSATDQDVNNNAAISFRVVRGATENDVTSFLSINSENGDISALKSFDFETLKTFQFQVVATDSGTPSLSSNVTVHVFILDQNDNAPIILYPLSSNGSAEGVEEIPRNVNAGHLVTKVRAYDADIGYNGWLLFSLQEVTDHSLFGLDRYTGQIRTLRSFTETDEAEHKLVILVKDNGNVSLSATATVIVKVVEPKEAFAASDVKSATNDEEDNNVTFYLMITLGSVSTLFLISIIVLIAMQCSKSTEYTSKYLQETNYDGTLCHSIQYRSGENMDYCCEYVNLLVYYVSEYDWKYLIDGIELLKGCSLFLCFMLQCDSVKMTCNVSHKRTRLNFNRDI